LVNVIIHLMLLVPLSPKVIASCSTYSIFKGNGINIKSFTEKN
jgi:hypothetical protein